MECWSNGNGGSLLTHYSTTPSLHLPVAHGPETSEERFALALELLLQLHGTIAIAAGPRLRSVFVPAVPPGMRVFHREKLEVFLPIGPLFLQRRIAKTRFNPARNPRGVDPRLLHIVLVFVTCDGALTERLVVDGEEKRILLAGLHAGFNEVAHGGDET